MSERTCATIKEWFRLQKWKRRHVATLKQTGWDGKCRVCGKWHFTDHAANFESEEPMHWNFKCQCGHVNRYTLAFMFPMADEHAPKDNPNE